MIGTAGSGSAYSSSSAHRRPQLDPWLLGATAFLLFAGFAALYSQSSTAPEAGLFRKQVILTMIGLVPFAIFWRVHPEFWRRVSPVLYFVSVALLALVMVAGSTIGGSQRWINFGFMQFQPSELSKLLLAITLSAYYANRIDQVKRLSVFLVSLLHIVPIAYLVFIQPHLGATLVVITVWLAISIAAGVPWKFILGALALGLTLFSFAIVVPGVLTAEQKSRLGFVSSQDSSDDHYQQQRARLAFGVGGLMGSGYLQGEQKEGRFIPEQENDFIFTVIGEEGGLVGSALVLSAFGFFFFRVWLVAVRAVDPFARMVAVGIFAMLAFHMTVNLAMNLGLGPVVGLWLPFISYGGTAMWLCLACVGLLTGLRRMERERMF